MWALVDDYGDAPTLIAVRNHKMNLPGAPGDWRNKKYWKDKKAIRVEVREILPKRGRK